MANLSADSNTTVPDADDPWSCHWPDEEPFNNTLSNAPTLWAVFIFWPILIILSSIGSTLVVLVQLSEKKKSTTNVYLTVMSVSNIIMMWLCLPRYHDIVNSQSGAWDGWKAYPASARWNGVGTWLQCTAMWLSDCTLVVFSLERLVCTANPLKFMNFFTVKRAVYIELALVIVSAVWNVEYLVSNYYMLVHDFNETPQLMTWDSVMLQIDAFRSICIWIILTVTDLVLIKILTTHTAARKKMVNSPTPKTTATKSGEKNHTSAVLLLGSSGLYLIAQFPYIIYTLLMMSGGQPYCTLRFSGRTDGLTWPIVSTLQMVNYSVDYFIFYASSGKFRQQVNDVFSGFCGRFGGPNSFRLAQSSPTSSESSHKNLTATSSNTTIISNAA